MDFEYTTTGNKREDLNDDRIELISIAGVFIDEDFNVIKEYYELVKPSIKNRILSNYCKELTGIKDEDIVKANDFNTVINGFCSVVNQYNNYELEFYTWGNFDDIALRKSIKINNYKGDFTKIRRKIKNIQPKISRMIRYKGNIYKLNWGLQKIKYVLGMEISETHHEALSDARDLKNLYIAYRKKIKPEKSRLEEIIKNEKKNQQIKKLTNTKNIKSKDTKTEDKVTKFYNSIKFYKLYKLKKPLIGYLKQVINCTEFYEYNKIKLDFHKKTLSLDMDNISNDNNVDRIIRDYLKGKNILYKDIGLSIDSCIKDDKKCIKITLYFNIDKNLNKSIKSKLKLSYIVPIQTKSIKTIKFFVKSIKENKVK